MVKKIMSNSNDFTTRIGQFKSFFLDLWWESESYIPNFPISYSQSEKKKCENDTDQFIHQLTQRLEKKSVRQRALSDIHHEIYVSISEFMNSVSSKPKLYWKILMSDDYRMVTEEFISKTRDFDPDLSIKDIFQAIRNVWIMNSIQLFFNHTIKLTPSIWAYSLLYPYTDNYLDQPELSIAFKKEFCLRLKNRLLGLYCLSTNKSENKIFYLVQMIEEQYPRDRFPIVYDSLLSIHYAQMNSISQQERRYIPYECDILGITFEKGGTSVLTDGYLIKPDMTDQESRFLFGFGVFLQLMDDLQDSQKDFQNSHTTIMSQLIKKWPLDILVNRLIHFIRSVLDMNQCSSFSSPNIWKEMIEDNCFLLIFMSIAKNQILFSKKYLKTMEEYSQYRYSYLKTMSKKIKKSLLKSENYYS